MSGWSKGTQRQSLDFPASSPMHVLTRSPRRLFLWSLTSSSEVPPAASPEKKARSFQGLCFLPSSFRSQICAASRCPQQRSGQTRPADVLICWSKLSKTQPVQQQNPVNKGLTKGWLDMWKETSKAAGYSVASLMTTEGQGGRHSQRASCHWHAVLKVRIWKVKMPR